MKTLSGTERTFGNMLDSLKQNFMLCQNSCVRKKTHGQHPPLGHSKDACSALIPTIGSTSGAMVHRGRDHVFSVAFEMGPLWLFSWLRKSHSKEK